MRITKLILALSLLVATAQALPTLYAWNGDCALGGQQAVTSGLGSSGTYDPNTSHTSTGGVLVGSYPQCQVTVYLTGTLTTATIYSTVGGAALGNPFNADVYGRIFFWAAAAGYDVVASSGTGPAMPISRTWTDIVLGASSGGSGTVGSGTIHQAAIYPATGTTVQGDTLLTDSGTILDYTGTGGIVAPGIGDLLGNNITFSGPGGVNILDEVGDEIQAVGSSILLQDASVDQVILDSGEWQLINSSGAVSVKGATSFGILATDNIGTRWGTPTGGSEGTGTINAQGLFVNGVAVGTGAGLPLPAEVGDTARYNVAGNGQWDATNFAGPVSYVYPAWGSTGPAATGPINSGNTTGTGSHSNINPTATVGTGDQWSASATGSTSTVIGYTIGQNGNNSQNGMLAFYRWSLKFQAGNTTNVRYWMGLGCYNSSGLGNNPAAILASTGYASDSPNKTTLGFRFSAGTDTAWQAVAAVGGGSQTTVSTGVAMDTNIHLFEMTTNSTGTQVNYFIDLVKVASITTNLPVPSTGANSWGNLFWTGDNKNTATAISGTQYFMAIAYK